jgi:hypothetical protein
MGKKVLLVSTMQNDFFNESGAMMLPIENKEEFKTNIAKLVKDFDGYVFLSKYETFEESVVFNILPKYCIMETEGSEIINEINTATNEKCGENPDFIPYIFNSREIINYHLCTTIADICSEPDSELHIVGISLNGNILDNLIQIINDAVYRREFIPKVFIHKDIFFDSNKELFNIYLETKLAPYFNVHII